MRSTVYGQERPRGQRPARPGGTFFLVFPRFRVSSSPHVIGLRPARRAVEAAEPFEPFEPFESFESEEP